MAFHKHTQQILFSPRFQRRPPMTNVLDEWSPPLIKFFCSWRIHSDQNRNTEIRSEYMATQNLFWLLKGWNECVTSGLVQNSGSEKNWPESSFEVFHKILQQTWIYLLANPYLKARNPAQDWRMFMPLAYFVTVPILPPPPRCAVDTGLRFCENTCHKL